MAPAHLLGGMPLSLKWKDMLMHIMLVVAQCVTFLLLAQALNLCVKDSVGFSLHALPGRQ